MANGYYLTYSDTEDNKSKKSGLTGLGAALIGGGIGGGLMAGKYRPSISEYRTARTRLLEQIRVPYNHPDIDKLYKQVTKEFKGQWRGFVRKQRALRGLKGGLLGSAIGLGAYGLGKLFE